MPPVEGDAEDARLEQSEEDQQWGLHVGDVVQIVQGRSKQLTYALYCGRGRAIHVWSPSRRNFRVRVDSLRGLKLSGYKAASCTRELDEFFHDLLNIDPVKPVEVVRRAKTVLHATAASRVSSLSLVLFARYGGDTIFTLFQLLKEAYVLAFDDSIFGISCDEHQESPEANESHLDLPVHPTKPDAEANNQVVARSIKTFFGSVGDLLMSEWLGNSLSDYFQDSRVRSNWYSIHLPSTILAPLFVQYDHQQAIFRVQFARTLAHRLAADRMECAICWMDFTPLKVMLLKCHHYMCDPCLRLLPRRECPWCRGSTRHAQPVSELVKRAALRLLTQSMQLENKSPVPLLEETDLDQEPQNHDDDPADNN
ncbi:hypothetical protein F442_06137 [Phytophthora nicotianae P10297]|uniref:RING-type domain-containing protein n=1 Tax=Phytophthora nicotianae P10297 TaxID=1317064 RepID=W2ZM25_PHYNI|nr:hypothetical protein F442_06137 [Phytophthora nicotianae P10297]